jgi:hypothetical protein
MFYFSDPFVIDNKGRWCEKYEMYSRVDRFKKIVIYSLDVACSDS